MHKNRIRQKKIIIKEMNLHLLKSILIIDRYKGYEVISVPQGILNCIMYIRINKECPEVFYFMQI